MTTQPDVAVDHIDYNRRDLPIHTVTSADGTVIAFEKTGSGPPVVIVGGGLNEKAMHAELADGLSHRFTVYNYDRRGRGASGDNTTGDYDVLREVEDLEAVIDATGQACAVFANCTGGMIAVRAAADGLPITKLALYEPPYGAPQPDPGYLTELRELLQDERTTDAVALFLKHDALFSDDEIEYFQTHPIWPAFEAMAHSMPYDSSLSVSAATLPTSQLARIQAPALVLGGQESPEWMIGNCERLAGSIPNGTMRLMRTAGHLMDDVVGAEILTDFFAAQAPTPPAPHPRRSERASRVKHHAAAAATWVKGIGTLARMKVQGRTSTSSSG